MKNFFNGKTARILFIGLASLAVLLVVFGAGVAVGYRNGLFASRFGEDYYHNFIGGRSMGMPMMGMPPVGGHGAIGTVMSVGSSTIITKDLNGNEQSIVVDGKTSIRRANQTIALGSIVDGDHVAVIGDPNGSGQIYARFIRVFDASSSIPQPPDGQPGIN